MGRFLLHSRTRYVASWVVALISMGSVSLIAWNWGNVPQRRDGNNGHITIDFGCQWIMGRLVARGLGPSLYDRNKQRQVLLEALPRSDQAPGQQKSDVEDLMEGLNGSDDPEVITTVGSLPAPLANQHPLATVNLLAAGNTIWTPERIEAVQAPRLGGALYPPVHGLYCLPIGYLSPRLAYRVTQISILLLLFGAGWLLSRISWLSSALLTARMSDVGCRSEKPQGSETGLWWPIAILFVMVFPDYTSTINLAQNSMFSLTFLLLGWWLWLRGNPMLAGVAWACLAFKPVWAVSFLLVPVLLRSWRMVGAMVLTGTGLILITLPVCGLEPWFQWVKIGQIASREYALYKNWVFLSRDLMSIPRRYLLEFDGGVSKNPDDLLHTALGVSLWLTVVLVTVLVVCWRRRDLLRTGPRAAFVLLGGWFACYHFMYYDVLLAALPVGVLVAHPVRFVRRNLWSPLGASGGSVVAESGSPHQAPGDLPLSATTEPTARAQGRRRGPRSEERAQGPEQGGAERELTRKVPQALQFWGSAGAWMFNALLPILVSLLLLVPKLADAFHSNYHYPPYATYILLGLWIWCALKWTGTPD